MGHVETQGLQSTAQEEALIERINALSSRSLPPTLEMVQNLVEDLVQAPARDH